MTEKGSVDVYFGDDHEICPAVVPDDSMPVNGRWPIDPDQSTSAPQQGNWLRVPFRPDTMAMTSPRTKLRLQHSAQIPVRTLEESRSVREQLVPAMACADAVKHLAQRLNCTEDKVIELLGYWLPRGPSGLRNQMLGVFANMLHLKASCLREVIDSCTARSELLSAPAQRAFAETVAAEGRAGPKVVWRRARVPVAIAVRQMAF